MCNMVTQFLIFCVLMYGYSCGTPIFPRRNYLNDYAWRDYEGSIPDDALKGGQDKLGKPIFIGQALYENSLIPGKIYQNNPSIYFEWYNKEYVQQRNVKILCSSTPNKFQWIPTESDKLGLLTNKILLKGGFEDKYSTYLGRAFLDGETVVGKVICNADGCLGLYTSSNGVAKNIKTFEILTYNAESFAPEVIIDVRNN